MIRRLALCRLAGLAVPVLLLSACQSAAPPPSASAGMSGRQGRVDAERAAFCRQRAEEIYMTQNRGDLYRMDNRDAPFSGGFVSGMTNRGLPDRFAQDRMIADCIRNTGERMNPVHPADAGPGPTPPSGSVGPGFTTQKAPPPPPPAR